MGWRERYKVHPAAAVFPMLSDEELAKLGQDIKANGLKMPMAYTVLDGAKFILDGRNRLEAMERAGMEIPFGMLQPFTCCADHDTAASTIISVNIKRRHLTKQQQADLIVAVLKAAEQAKAEAEKGCQAGTVSAEPHKGGRGNKAPLKVKAVAEGQKLDIGKRTMQRSLAKASGKKLSKGHRRTGVEIKRDAFIRFMDALDNQHLIEASDPKDPVLDLLTKEQRTYAIEAMVTAIGRLRKIIERLKDREAAA